MPDAFVVEVVVDAAAEDVWLALTDVAEVERWVGEPSMQVRVTTTWEVGTPIVFTGFHHAQFRNTGVVQVFDRPRRLQYTHLSSISRLPDVSESYTTCEFTLTPHEQKTKLTARFSGFPTLSIYKHLSFYWRGTLPLLQRHIEGAVR